MPMTRLTLLLLSAVAFLHGCSSPPQIIVTAPDGRIISVTGQAGQSEPATVTVNGIEASTGGVDQALADLSSSTSWAALMLIFGGIGLIVASAWLPFLPRSTSVVMIAAGAGLYAFPVLLDRYSLIVFVGIALIGVLLIFGTWDNRRKLANGGTPN